MEYTVNCIFSYAASRGISPFSLRVGIVGYGNVGKQLAMILGRIGIKTLINDPPLQERDGGSSTFFYNATNLGLRCSNLACSIQ